MCAGYGFTPEYILNGGYYKAHRLWNMLLEAKANDLLEQTILASMPHMSEKDRKGMIEHLKRRQPRRHQRTEGGMPPELLAKFKENFEENQRKALAKWQTTTKSSLK